MTKNSELTIGQLAAAAGVHVETVRYYQRRGLLRVPPRSPGSIARYPQASAQRLRFIKRAQTLGFSLDQIASLLHLSDIQACAPARTIAQTQLAETRTRLQALRALEQALVELLAQCDAESEAQHCPLIDSLMDDTQTA